MRNSGNIYMHVIAAGADWMGAILPTVLATFFQDMLLYLNLYYREAIMKTKSSSYRTP